MAPASYIRLQPRPHTVAASVTYGCSLRHIRLQVRFDWHHKAQPALRLRTQPEAVVAAKDAFSRQLLEGMALTLARTRTLTPEPEPEPEPEP